MMLLRALCVVFLGLPFVQAYAAEGDAARATIQKIAPLQQISAFRKSALPGYYEGVIAGQVAYASADGRYLVRGSVEDVEQDVSLSDLSMAARRKELLAELGDSGRLSFSPADPQFRVTVFTDVDCPYCRRLHTRIDEYNSLGIAIDYVFFPLSIHPGADRKSVSIWCSENRQLAYTAALMGQNPDVPVCDNPLTKMREAGNAMGVVQTPTAIAPDGSMIDSTVLLSPQRLLSSLRKLSADSASSKLAASAAAR
ncbi:DsbC family protein [Dokdonella sp.]|uniref:DsbC family protein n=1 Tax=Dokdonella sp. TaxID=2291710 RepID=UPI003C54384E